MIFFYIPNKSLVSKLNLQPHISARSKPADSSQIHRSGKYDSPS